MPFEVAGEGGDVGLQGAADDRPMTTGGALRLFSLIINRCQAGNNAEVNKPRPSCH
jgi:hypothetical protein